ncbi:MAG: type I 3-dehydroquinate dehydratase [Desulfurococcales archaeon]|nr:type I 3-dehydroquinate dehydratase [Desulfurococcales archaeon]
MLCTIIPARSPGEALMLADSSPTRCVEVRADFMDRPWDALDAVEALASKGFFVVATLRLRGEGGLYDGPPIDAVSFSREALGRGARLVDVDARVLEAYGVPAGSGVVASIHSETLDNHAVARAEDLLESGAFEAVKVVGGGGVGEALLALKLDMEWKGRASAFLTGRGWLSVATRAAAEVLGAPIVYGVHEIVESRLPHVPPISAVIEALRSWEGGLRWRLG